MRPAEDVRKLIKLELGVLTALLFLCCMKADLHMAKTPPAITSRPGKTLTIPCVLTQDDGRPLNLDLTTAAIYWKKTSANGSQINVYRFRNLSHAPIRPESSIDERELERGNASLTLRRLQGGDEGEYACTIFLPHYNASAKVNLRLLAQPEVSLSVAQLSADVGSEKSVTCTVSRFYPKAVRIGWVKHSKGVRTSLDTYITAPREDSDGTYSVSSLLTITPNSPTDSGDSYSCNVSHDSLTRDKDLSFTLIVNVPAVSNGVIAALALCASAGLCAALLSAFQFKPAVPKISDIIGTDDLTHGKSSTLSCMVSDFKPKNIEIQFCLKRVGESAEQEIDCWKYPTPPSHHHGAGDPSGGREKSQLLDIQKIDLPKYGLPMEKTIKPLAPMKCYFSYSCLCFTRIVPDIEKDEGAEIIVKVTHGSLKSPLIVKETLKINGEVPKVSDIVEVVDLPPVSSAPLHSVLIESDPKPDCFKLSPIIAPKPLIHGEAVTLTCHITKNSAGPVHITWLKRDMMKREATRVICKKGEPCDPRYSHTLEHQNGGVFTISSSLTFRAKVSEDHGKIYICRAYYPALRQKKKSIFDMYVRAVPVMTPMASKPLVPLPGQQMELSCNIFRFHPREVTVEWYREGDLLPHRGDTTRIGDDGLFSMTSTLKLTFEQEDMGKTFTCKVGHESLKRPKILERTMISLRRPLNNTEDDEPETAETAMKMNESRRRQTIG